MKKFTFFLSFAIAANLILNSIAFGQIKFVNSQTASSTVSTPLSITKPLYLAEGDIMIATILQSDNDDVAGVFANATSVGGDWTIIDGRNLETTTADNNGWHATVLYKIASISDVSAVSFSFNLNNTASNDGNLGAIAAFSGVDNVTPFDVLNGTINTTNSDDLLATSKIPVTTNTAILMLGMVGDDRTFSGWSTSSPGALTQIYTAQNSSGPQLSIGAAWQTKTNLVTTGNGVAELSSNESDANGAILLALRPAPAASLTPGATQSVIAGAGNVAFTATALNFGGAGNYTYDWDAPGATIPGPVSVSSASESNSKTITFPTPGTYNVSVTISKGGATTRVTNTTIVYALATPALANAPTASPNPCSGGDDGTPVVANTCPQGTFSASFVGGVLFSNAGSNGLAAGSVWRYSNVATNGDGDIFNAEITVDAAFQAVLTAWDNDAAPDENGNTTNLQTFFAPTISADQNLGTTDRNGFIQFTIKFWKNGWSIPALLDGINYSHYDIDGTNGSLGYWFRETGVVKHPGGSLAVTANAPTELIPYNYVAGTDTWTGFAGTICNRDGFSRFAEVAANFKYPIFQSSVTIRMGYDYNDLPATGTFGSATSRLYASKFECFTFPAEINLPVKLISFTGSYKNNNTLLNWVAENQVDFDRYEIERSSDGINFNAIALKPAQGSATSREYYNYNDNLAGESSNIFYYRLKMVDADGTFKYSKIILIRKDQKTLPGITINPNPLVSGSTATVRFEVQSKSIVTFRVIDMSGRVLLSQKNNVAEGINSVSVNNFERLQPGTYVIQMNDGTSVQTTKFIISQ